MPSSFMLPSIDQIKLENKRVFVRADLNVPLRDGQIVSDFKLRRIIPTLEYLQSKSCSIILATHLGRPQGKESALSTIILADWLQSNGFEVEYSSDLNPRCDRIVLLENLRFFPGEQEQSEAFAKQLAALADVFVHEATGLYHRADTSITLLPRLFKERCAGPLLAEEIEKLMLLRNQPKQPFVLVIGGNKTEDKLPLLLALIERNAEARPNSILVGGAVANTFLAAQGVEVGNSLIEEKVFDDARAFLARAHERNVHVHLPKDLVLRSENNEEGVIAPVGHIPTGATGIDIGPATVEAYVKKIEHARTVLVNGTMGIYTDEISADGTRHVLEAIAEGHAKSFVCGGDATAAAHMFRHTNKYTYLFTGGGAALAFLGCNDPAQLPGLTSLQYV